MELRVLRVRLIKTLVQLCYLNNNEIQKKKKENFYNNSYTITSMLYIKQLRFIHDIYIAL